MPDQQYSQIPNPSSDIRDPDRELDDAFGPDDDDNNDIHSPTQHSPLIARTNDTSTALAIHTHARSPSQPPAYDFERQDYDFPPPGSPPRPTDRALPNTWGNSNGLLPEAPAGPPPNHGQPSIFRRALASLWPSKYQALASSDGPASRTVGGGTDNDGVFANVMAKPQVARTETAADGSIYVVPEDSQKELPPTYAEAQSDAVPPYWETTVHAPFGGSAGETADGFLIIDDLPTGSFLIFALNFLFSWLFQFIGFFLTYLLHTTHAAKFGSRAGLGMTLIQYGFASRVYDEDAAAAADAGYPLSVSNPPAGTNDGAGWWSIHHHGNATMMGENPASDPQHMAMQASPSSRDWMSFLFMTVGWFLFLSSFVGFWRVKRWESSLRPAAVAPPPADDRAATTDEIERDNAIRANLAQLLGVNLRADDSEAERSRATIEAEVRLQRDLHRAGLI